MNNLCKKCGSILPDDAKFCPNCATPLTSGSSDNSWIASMQEKIKEKKTSRKFTLWCCIASMIGAVVAFAAKETFDALSIAMNYHPQNDTWLIAFIIFSILYAIFSFIFAMRYNKQVDSLIDQLARGQIKQ